VPSFEYQLMSFEWGSYRLVECRGESALAPDEDTAKRELRARLAANVTEDRASHRREHAEQRAQHDQALSDWTQRHDDTMSTYQVEVVEETVRKMGKYTVRRERVVLPDGEVRVFEMGYGAAFVEQSVLQAVGAPPAAPELEDLTDDEYLDRALAEVKATVVDRWKGTIEPADEDFDGNLVADELGPRSVAELNRLGAQGWKVVDVSEDRAITADEVATATTVVGVRYTLMREVTA
jgi:hypothetical protein